MKRLIFVFIFVIGGCVAEEGQRGDLCMPAAQGPALIQNWGDLIKVARLENIHAPSACASN